MKYEYAYKSSDGARHVEEMDAPLYVGDSEFTEYVDLKRITAGIKHEMRAYIRGGGTAADDLRELVTRQKLECSYREKPPAAEPFFSSRKRGSARNRARAVGDAVSGARRCGGAWRVLSA